MIAEMMDKGKCLMRVDGPYGVPGGPGWQNHDALVIIAGGIGELNPRILADTGVTQLVEIEGIGEDLQVIKLWQAGFSLILQNPME